MQIQFTRLGDSELREGSQRKQDILTRSPLPLGSGGYLLEAFFPAACLYLACAQPNNF